MGTTTHSRSAAAAQVIDSIWVASALAYALGTPALDEQDPAFEVLAQAGLIEPGDTSSRSGHAASCRRTDARAPD